MRRCVLPLKNVVYELGFISAGVFVYEMQCLPLEARVHVNIFSSLVASVRVSVWSSLEGSKNILHVYTCVYYMYMYTYMFIHVFTCMYYMYIHVCEALLVPRTN